MDDKINIFLDTNIFVQMKYDFLNKQLLGLKKYSLLGIVNLFTNEIVVREVEAHIKTDTAAESAHLKNAEKKHCFREILNLDNYKILNKDFREEKWDEVIISKFREYLIDTHCEVLKNDDIKLNDIFDDYFRMVPPFESREKKKHEFPDAVMIKRIKNFVTDNYSSMVVVTNDDGWIKALVDRDDIKLFSDLKQALIWISSKFCDTDQSVYLKFICSKNGEVANHIKDWLENVDWNECFEIDLPFDFLGIYKFEIEKIELVFCGFEYIDRNQACARFKAFASIGIEYEYDDYDCAIYDKEDGMYYNVKHGTIKEKHVCPIEFSVNILSDDGNFCIGDYEFDDVELTNDTVVSSEVYEEDDDVDFDDEYLTKNAFTICPKCGKPIGIENDGLNGFCRKCGENN